MNKQFIRLVSLTVASLLGLWIVHRFSLLLWGDRDGKLTEYGQFAFAYLISMYTSCLLHYLATGRWLPLRGGVVADSSMEPKGRPAGVSSTVALVVLSVAWLGIYFLADLLIQAAAQGLFNPAVLGVSIPENEANRLGSMFAGIIYIGTFLPLSAVASFLCGWSASARLPFRSGWVPSILFVVIAFIYHSGKDVLETGLPPSIDVIRTIFRISNQIIIPADIAIMWLITLLFCGFLSVALCVYFYFWSRLGRVFRGVV